MKPTIVQGESITLVIGACSHDNEQTSVGPTTDQINHWCPDCLSRWTTWPDRASGVAVAPGPRVLNALEILQREQNYAAAVAALAEIRRLTRKLLDEPEKWNGNAVLTRIFGLTVDGAAGVSASDSQRKSDQTP